MRRIIFTAAAAVAAGAWAAPAFADDSADAVAVVKQFIDGFNTGDIAGALAACAATAHVIDEFAPYEWSGEGACETWANDYAADAEAKGITDGVVTLHDAKHVYVTGDRAYVVSPVEYVYMVDGKKQGQKDSTLTSTLAREDGAWKITAWAWSTGKLKD